MTKTNLARHIVPFLVIILSLAFSAFPVAAQEATMEELNHEL